MRKEPKFPRPNGAKIHKLPRTVFEKLAVPGEKISNSNITHLPKKITEGCGMSQVRYIDVTNEGYITLTYEVLANILKYFSTIKEEIIIGDIIIIGSKDIKDYLFFDGKELIRGMALPDEYHLVLPITFTVINNNVPINYWPTREIRNRTGVWVYMIDYLPEALKNITWGSIEQFKVEVVYTTFHNNDNEYSLILDKYDAGPLRKKRSEKYKIYLRKYLLDDKLPMKSFRIEPEAIFDALKIDLNDYMLFVPYKTKKAQDFF